MPHTRKSAGSHRAYHDQTSFQHWYRDNQVYFISARCRDRLPAFAGEDAKQIFWRQFEKYVAQSTFTPWVTSLMDNHYHTLGHLKRGDDLPTLMKNLHGSVAKLVNDLLESQAGAIHRPGPHDPSRPLTQGRLVPFWRDSKHKNYFDGCLRDEKQGRLTYRYVLKQSERHGICQDWRDYAHTRVTIEMEPAIKHATELDAFLRGVRYKRYQRPKPKGPGR